METDLVARLGTKVVVTVEMITARETALMMGWTMIAKTTKLTAARAVDTLKDDSLKDTAAMAAVLTTRRLITELPA